MPFLFIKEGAQRKGIIRPYL